MKIRFLGSGGSLGVPQIGCNCEVCTSSNIKDRRSRASVFLSIDNINFLIDCGPDFRSQILQIPFQQIHGVLITHEHYDHVSGLDDLRPFNAFGDINIYTNKQTTEVLTARMPYCFSAYKYPGIPQINLQAIESNIKIENIEIIPINILHYKLPIFGYRIRNFAYLTDVKYLPQEEFSKLKNLDVLVINALRHEEHIAHLTLSEAIELATKIGAKKVYFTHLGHQIGLHENIQKTLPDNMYLSYDGLEINLK